MNLMVDDYISVRELQEIREGEDGVSMEREFKPSYEDHLSRNNPVSAIALLKSL